MPDTIQPLTSVPLGTNATVAQINVAPENRPRLMEMGLLVGTRVELIRFAPMGDPVEIKVRGYNLTLRRHEAQNILVRTGPAS
jgi:Fe2+ transport system protein FeoA